MGTLQLVLVLLERMQRTVRGRKFHEICCFLVLLVLIIAQVMLDRFGHDYKPHGLSLDKAKLVFYNNLTAGYINVSQKSSNCYKCSPSPLTNTSLLPGGNPLSYSADTTCPVTIFLQSNSSQCNITQHFREYSLHHFSFSHGEVVNCSSVELDHGDNAFLPVLYAALAIALLSVTWVGITKLDRFLLPKGRGSAPDAAIISENESENVPIQNKDPYDGKGAGSSPRTYGSVDRKRRSAGSALLKTSLITKGTSDSGGRSTPVEDTIQEAKGKTRLRSLDAFRGFSLIIMIFVNYGGGGYWFFNHSKWNGLTVADLVFPWFVWIMGVSLVFSFRGRRKDSVLQQLYQVIRRTVILFGFGLFFISNDGSLPLSQMRISGVLQRLAATYCVVAVTEIVANQLYHKKNFTIWAPLKDVTNNWVQWVMVAVLETLWLMLTFLLHDSGCPRGYLGAGGIAESGDHKLCTGGAARVVDYWILGEHHMYPRNTATTLYQLVQRFEPEGVLGTVNSVVLCFLGVQAGRTLLYFKGRHSNIVARFLTWGVALSTLATLLCLGQKDEGLIPINKNLWSLSYTLLLAGFGYLVLAVFYLIMDFFPIWNGAPFIYPGMNSILIYMGHEILQQYFPFSVHGEKNTHLTFLSSNLHAVALWLLISYYLYSVQFFFKV